MCFLLLSQISAVNLKCEVAIKWNYLLSQKPQSRQFQIYFLKSLFYVSFSFLLCVSFMQTKPTFVRALLSPHSLCCDKEQSPQQHRANSHEEKCLPVTPVQCVCVCVCIFFWGGWGLTETVNYRMQITLSEQPLKSVFFFFPACLLRQI